MSKLLSLILVFSCGIILGQQSSKKIKLIQADVIEYDANLVKAQRLIGKVILEHEGSRMYCDSAYLYEEGNRFESFGNVRITDQKKLTITGDRLDYHADNKMAKIYDNITLRDGDMTLTTDYVEYNLDERRASYFGGGHIISSANQNVLTSELGHYFAESKIMHFKDKVLLENPEYTMETDTLHYHSFNEQAYFLGPTTIRSQENKIYCENGWYDTMNDRARFGEHAHIWSNEQQLLGDSMYYDREVGIGEAYGNVMILDTLNSIEITGEKGRHDEKSDLSYVTEMALMQQYFTEDTLLLHADTLFMSTDTAMIIDGTRQRMRRIAAYNGVRIFKPDMQGVCDSLIYTEVDSLISLYHSPFIWSEQNQISGERIDIKTYEGEINSIYTENMAFIISEVDSIHFNQIKGRTLTGHFIDKELRNVSIVGNGESIYYGVEDEIDPLDSLSSPIQRILGVNISTCSDILIQIKDRTISQVKFITDTDNTFYPLNKVSPEQLLLKGFAWNNNTRPLVREDIFGSE